ncbi:hypothetical protein A4X13_0g8190, partial [Tilletia indica]
MGLLKRIFGSAQRAGPSSERMQVDDDSSNAQSLPESATAVASTSRTGSGRVGSSARPAQGPPPGPPPKRPPTVDFSSPAEAAGSLWAPLRDPCSQPRLKGAKVVFEDDDQRLLSPHTRTDSTRIRKLKPRKYQLALFEQAK